MPIHLNAREELLLREILEHRNLQGYCDSSYWKQRFYNPALTHDEDTLLRGTFGKLKNKGIIAVQWADDYPCDIEILDDGLTYFDDKGTVVDMAEKPTIFVSYQHSSGYAFVDDLEEVLTGKADVLRDKHLGAWSDLSDFMESIRDQDFAVLVITDEYLKSVACMTEVTHFMREHDWDRRVMFAVLDESVYANTDAYRRYWEERRKELNERRKGDSIGSSELQSIAEEIGKIDKFSSELNDFFKVLCAKKNPKVWRIIIDILMRIESSTDIDPMHAIPQEFQQLTKDMNTRNSMTETAAQLLVAAAQKREQIICVQDLGGWTIGIINDPKSRITDVVQVEYLLEAINQLERLSLIRATSAKRELFSVTAEGYRIAQKLEVEMMLD